MGKFVIEVDPFQFITSMKCLRSYFDQVVRATKLLYLRVTKALFPYFRDGRGQSEFFQFFANPKCILRQLPFSIADDSKAPVPMLSNVPGRLNSASLGQLKNRSLGILVMLPNSAFFRVKMWANILWDRVMLRPTYIYSRG